MASKPDLGGVNLKGVEKGDEGSQQKPNFTERLKEQAAKQQELDKEISL